MPVLTNFVMVVFNTGGNVSLNAPEWSSTKTALELNYVSVVKMFAADSVTNFTHPRSLW